MLVDWFKLFFQLTGIAKAAKPAVAVAHPVRHSGLFKTPAPQELILDRLEGVWELESWDDGGTVSTTPEVSGRWFHAEGELAVILHDRKNKEWSSYRN